MNNILFFGTYEHKVDSKGRVSIPAEWRKYLVENELFIFKAEWTDYHCFINLDKHNKEDFQYIKKYNIDSTGRVYININTNNVLLKGCGDYFTIEFLGLR